MTHLITNEQFRAFVATLMRDFPACLSKDDLQHWAEYFESETRGGKEPVQAVSWIEADLYCKLAGGRLPTRQELADALSLDRILMECEGESKFVEGSSEWTSTPLWNVDNPHVWCKRREYETFQVVINRDGAGKRLEWETDAGFSERLQTGEHFAMVRQSNVGFRCIFRGF